jgi:hypothetical protein
MRAFSLVGDRRGEEAGPSRLMMVFPTSSPAMPFKTGRKRKIT